MSRARRPFEAISERGGVLGAMDTTYQRGKLREEWCFGALVQFLASS